MLAVVRTELLEGLGTELDALLDDPDPGRRLAERHGFREEHLEQFARLLFELVAAEPQRTERCRMARAIAAIHRYLDERRAPRVVRPLPHPRRTERISRIKRNLTHMEQERIRTSLPENAYRELKSGEEYTPLMPASTSPREATVYSVLMGVVMAVVFSAAAAFLGLKVGQVFEAAIPIAIIAVGMGNMLGKRTCWDRT